ncbi:hypothetical protein IRJ41_013324 [Triplophysa rosa]|uniref:Uncharacterized protein n=1 Tax=Triplophysa rosa TaxID=992332 RepID=A0A9W7TAS6_TRIRA|nr:hypothetical protein IRJ41_013324 [Triplophysa rosa]
MQQIKDSSDRSANGSVGGKDRMKGEQGSRFQKKPSSLIIAVCHYVTHHERFKWINAVKHAEGLPQHLICHGRSKECD